MRTRRPWPDFRLLGFFTAWRKLRHETLHIGLHVPMAMCRYLPKRQRAPAKSHTCLHLDPQATAEMIHLQAPHHHHKLIFLELISVSVEQRFIR